MEKTIINGENNNKWRIYLFMFNVFIINLSKSKVSRQEWDFRKIIFITF